MTTGNTISALLLVGPALWSTCHLVLSRMAENKAARMQARGADEADVAMATKRARTLQDFSSLMPTWLLIVFLIGLIWRAVALISDLF